MITSLALEGPQGIAALPSAPRGQRKLCLNLTVDEYAKFRVLAVKLELSQEEAARRLLNAAVDALADYDIFAWPLFLEPGRIVPD